MIVKKEVFYTIGLYDPHIILARICDWDLWLRISKQYTMKKINVLIGSEYGNTTENSLGNVYQHQHTVAKNYLSRNRNIQLLPQNFSSANIFKSIDTLDDKTNFYINQLKCFFSEKIWYKNTDLSSEKHLKKIIYCGFDCFNFYLYFEALNNDNAGYITEAISGHSYDDLYFVLDADLVIFNGTLDNYINIIRLLIKINIPCYYFTDDEYTQINKKFKPSVWHSKRNMRKIIAQMNGILVSTQALKTYFIEERLHTNVECYLPILNDELLDYHMNIDDSVKHGMNIAIIGRVHSLDVLVQYIIPAFNEINLNVPITLYLCKGTLNSTNTNKFQIVEYEFQENHDQCIHMLREMKIDILINPDLKTNDSIYQTDFMLLIACYIYANILVIDDSFIDRQAIDDGVLRIHKSVPAIVSAILRCGNSEEANQLKQTLRVFYSEKFNIKNNLNALDRLTKNDKKINYLEVENRSRMLHLWMSNFLQIEEKKYHLSTLFRFVVKKTHTKPLMLYLRKLVNLCVANH